ncbi:16S rRNA (uracil(1498)-N(3))-methyltransferase [Bacteroidales bacterium OttesenSCG-928-K03]|nr:16S rRNA (uracil(1498)-N(3))-methyltransferase [Odoribacter sp. OttesenSCG-928-L07]MDL2240461.1 16S rRNA (uracil(1498)-N(3))-methyltransferase [Bacteroidales bacterium OttesenSCG-928-K22]MDL2243012.1 16S rRNA (uracil(1498)-N(3))-methyltransferase [Bacteroidales bacterium OttesenSCG-928-K03]
MEIFYQPNIKQGYYSLTEDESRHIIKVLRKNVGDIIKITDGKGKLFNAEIVEIVKKNVSVNALSFEVKPTGRDYYFHLAVAPTKMMDRFEWIVEKCVEIGIDEISPIICEHSERKVIKNERLTNIAVSAMKQSGNINLPKINEQQTFNELMKNKFEGNLCIAHCYDENKSFYFNEVKEGYNLILIGPEGDFSKSEVETAINSAFKPVSLGNSILRVETAAVVACVTTSIKNQK